MGDETVTLRVNDGTVDVDTTFIIHVGNTNDAPSFTSVPDTTALQGAFYTYTATAEDIDLGDTLTFSALALPAWLNFDSTTHVLSGNSIFRCQNLYSTVRLKYEKQVIFQQIRKQTLLVSKYPEIWKS